MECETNQCLVLINLYKKFDVHSPYSGGEIDGGTDAPRDNNRLSATIQDRYCFVFVGVDIFFFGGGGGLNPCKARAFWWKIRVASSLNIKICKCWSQMKQRLCPIKFKWVKIQRWYLSRSKVKIKLYFVDKWCNINPSTAGVAYIGFFTQLLPHSVPPFKHVKAIMWHQSWRFEKSCPPFCQIWIIFTHLKLWIASARHNFKWVKIQIEYSGG